MRLDDLLVYDTDSFLAALKKINHNHRGFVMVTDNESRIDGTLTDGDIRRALIQGTGLDQDVRDFSNKAFIFLRQEQSVGDALDVFRDTGIKFLPVLDSTRRLSNVVTKEALYTLMLQDIYPDLSYDFLGVDEKISDHAIQSRPWGFYKTTILNDTFQSKIISIMPGAALSFQKHKMREEHWIIVNGTGEIRLEDSVIPVRGGSYLFIPKGCKHRITNTSWSGVLTMVEIQRGEYFGEDDITRYEDVYGRLNEDK